MKIPQRRMSRPSFGGMMSTRQGAIVLALVCALSAAGIIMFALGRYRATLKQPVVVPQATVLVSTGQIAKGTTGAQIAARGLYRAMPITASQLTPGAIGDASALTGRVTVAAVLPGQQLTAADFTTQAGVLGELAPDQRAVSVTVGEAAGDIDVLQAGDLVDVYAQLASKNGPPKDVLLLRGAPVLQVPGGAGTAGVTKGTASPAGSLVLAVTTAQAPRVVYAAQNSQLYLTLRPSNADKTPSTSTDLGSVVSTSLSDPTTGARP